MTVVFATANAADFQSTESSRRLARVLAPVPALQFTREAADGAGAGVAVSPGVAGKSQAAKLSRAGRIAAFTDCIELAFGGLVLVGVLLFAAAALRLVWVDGQTAGAGLRIAARIVYAAAAITGSTTLCSVVRGIHQLMRR
jgi:hypothetical protein